MDVSLTLEPPTISAPERPARAITIPAPPPPEPDYRIPIAPSVRQGPPHFRLSSFEGPLDLLLQLVRANEVDVYDIPIAEITEQYLAALDRMEELDLAVAGEYLVMAATLIEIKSRMLLPQPPSIGTDDEAEDPRAELVARLLEYQQYRAVVDTFRDWEESRRQLFFRGPESADDYILPVPEGEASVAQLCQALHRLLESAGLDDRTVTAVTPRRRLSLRLKMIEIAARIRAAGPDGMAFDSLFELPCPLYDIVLAFLALLELLKMGRIDVRQAKRDAPIWLVMTGE
jgi:segregation and condensation protein A